MNDHQPKKFTVAPEALGLFKNASAFSIQLDGMVLKDIRKPRLFVCADGSALLRINFCLYQPVRIKKEHIRKIRQTRAVELIFFSSESSEAGSIAVPVSPVLRFPECCEVYPALRSKEEAGSFISLEDKLTSLPDLPVLPDLPDSATAAAELDKWLEKHSTFTCSRIDLAFEQREMSFCLITDHSSKLFLVSLFETAEEWIGSEKQSAGEVPLYYTSAQQCVSPVFALNALTDWLWCRTGLLPRRLVLLGDEVVISNIQELDRQWDSMHAKVCCCSQTRDSAVLKPFASYADKLVQMPSTLSESDISELENHFTALQAFTVEDLCKNHMRHYFLNRLYLRHTHSSNEAAMTEIWLNSAHARTILLGRFFFEGFFFNLVYNFQNIAIILENNPDMENGAETVLYIRRKLQSCGTQALLTPCIVSEKTLSAGLAGGVKNCNPHRLFLLEQFSFPREMGFDQVRPVTKDDVRLVTDFANDTFGEKGSFEASRPRLGNYYKAVLQQIEFSWKDKNLLLLYDTRRFVNPAWALLMFRNRTIYPIVIKIYNGNNLAEIKSYFAEEHKRNAGLFEFSKCRTVVIAGNVPETRENHIEINDVFYVGKADFMPLICKLIMDF